MRISAAVSIPDMSRAIRRAGAAEIERRANRYGGQMVDFVLADVRGRYNTDRGTSRRRSPGSQRIVNGWDYRVEGDPGSFPILLTLTTTGDDAYQKRIRYLNDGTPGHTIRAKTRRGGEGGYLQIPEGDGASPGPPWVYPKAVTHPGTTAGRFIERAQAQVIGRAKRAFL